MHQTIVPIKGMHCRSCEILIENNLKKIPGFSNANISYKKGEAEIYSKYPLSQELISKAIGAAGYEIGTDQKAWISRNPAEYKDIAIALLVLAILYFVAKNLGILNFNFGYSGKPSSLIVVLIVGLTAGVSTCMALVGGLILGMAARHSEKHPEATPLQKFRPHLYFNLGRITAFFLLGGLVGLIGKAFQLSSPTLGVLTIFVGIVMLVLGIQLTELFPRISSAGFTLPSGISKFFGIRKHHEKEYSHRNSSLVGALTFFLPCGFTQAMQLYAMSSGSFLSGGLIMATFALGTAPGLLGIGGLTSIVKGAFAKRFFKFSGLLVITLALLNISNGYNLTGWRGISFNNNTIAEAKTDQNVKLENGVQVVRMTQQSRGYSPNKFTIVKDVPVKWIINSKDPGSCASSIVASKIGVKKFLKAGENIIEFKPTEAGEIKFSCSMGMYTGKFTVVEDKQVADSANKNNISTFPSPTPSEVTSVPNPNAQLIKANYVATDINSTTDLEPNEFTVVAGKPVRFEIYAEVDGKGCMGTITIPKLVNSPQFLEKGKTVVFEFTPEKGTYYITCSMGAIRGKITAN